MIRYLLVVLVCTISVSSFAQDYTVTAPYTSPTHTTSGGSGNDCNLSGSKDREYEVTIPATGNWIFSLCGLNDFDSQIFVGTTLCSGDVGSNNDFCGTSSELTATIAAGTYYVTVEGVGNDNGDYILDISGPFAPTPANDLCTAAISIACGSTTTGTTVNATVDNEVFCGTGDDSGGVWYSFTGTGDDITASLCNNSNYNTKIRVFDGTCGSLTCVDGNDDSASCPGTESEVTFNSTLSVQYFILVHGSGATGDFDLDITCTPPPAPPGDECTDAISIGCGDVVTGTTVGMGVDNVPTCVTGDGTGGGVWYSYIGTGDQVTASLCNSVFDTKIRVFTGTCSALVCETGDDDGGCPGTQSAVSFTSVVGVEYFILVHGFSANEGTYELDITCTAPPGDECSTAFDIACGDVVTGSTVGFSPPTGTPACATAFGTGGSVWYTMPGTGADITASLCGSSYDTYLSVFSGSCGAGTLTCVGANDNDASCTPESEVTFTSVSGTTYYILVSGAGAAQGAYSLTIDCVTPPGSDCSDPIALNTGSLPYADTGNNTGFYGDDYSTSPCNSSYMGGDEVVYSYTAGTVDDYIEISAAFTAGWGGIHVLDDCLDGTPNCIAFAGSSGTSASTSCITVPAGTTYYIVISTFPSPQAIGYDLSIITCTPPGPEGNCSGAIPIACGDIASGNTAGYPADFAPTCVTGDGTGGGVWYQFIGTGQAITASLCGSAFDTKLRVFTGDCTSLTCVVGNDDGCGVQSQVTFTSVFGTSYYILVHGFGSNEGAYDLELTCLAAPNDDCAGAQPISCGQTLSGSTAGAGASTDITGLTCPPVSDGAGSGLWYVFTGTGDDVTASLCGSNFDTRIRLFTGANCTSLSCFAGNDNSANCGGNQSEVTFTSVLGTTYYILIDGATAADVGDFILSIVCFTPSDGGDICDDAVLITCDDTFSGTTVGPGTDNPPACSPGNGTGNGVWFQFIGTGDFITASLCGSSFDTRIRIYEGNCTTLTCNTGNDDYAGCSSTNNSLVSFESVIGTTYYILVHGTGSAEGIFTLSLSCNLPFTVSDCRGSEPICAEGSIADVNPTSSGNYNDLNFNNDDCLSGENATQWFYFKTLPSADIPGGTGSCAIEFTIQTASNTDYDFAVWGPYPSGPESCIELENDADPLRCSYSADPGFTGIMTNPPTETGWESSEPPAGDGWVDAIVADGDEYYILVIDNFSLNGEKFGVAFPPTTSSCLDCVILPIELLSFSGYALEGKNILEWTTAVEINNNYFTIERSHDSFDFHPIGTISGAGNSSQPLSYSMVDDDPLPGTNYYRMKQTDFDGTSETFHTIAIDTDNPIRNFSLFPNPGSDIITVISSSRDIARETHITIHDARGFVVEQLVVTAQNMRFDVSQLPAGIYMVAMTNDRTSETLTFVKQ